MRPYNGWPDRTLVVNSIVLPKEYWDQPCKILEEELLEYTNYDLPNVLAECYSRHGPPYIDT